MYPDMFLRIYRQQERELEQQLLHRLAARDRSPVARAPGSHQFRISSLRAHRKGTHG